SVAFSPGECWIVSTSWGKTTCIRDSQTSCQICTPLKGYAGVVLTAVFSPDGTKLVSGSVDNTIRVLNVNSSE
ncbi:hypothetical protein PISMIDRAFT_36554, partial [Pisolithus microcarpus 441]